MAQGRAAMSKDPARTRELYGQAYELLAKSFKIGLRYQTVADLAGARTVLDAHYPSDNTLETLLLAHDLAPQVGAIRVQAAHGLMLRQRYDAADQMLLPLITDPHAGAVGDEARRLLKEIESQREAKK